MSDSARELAAVALIRAKHPDASLYFRSSGWRYPGNGEPVEVVDYSVQDIGGEPDELGIGYRVNGRTQWLSDFDLPAPTLKPWSQCVQNARFIEGIADP